MKIVIDIDEDTYKDIKKGKVYSSYRDVPQESVLAIANGTPLPEGHGRLVDVDRLEQIQNERLQDGEIKIWELKLITSALDAAETVIEADGGDTE